MQDATPIIAIRNAIPATGYPPARVCHPLSEGNDQKRRAPVDCSVIRTGELRPRTSRLGRLMIPLTRVARAHRVSPKPGVVLFLLRPSKNSLVNDQVVGPLPEGASSFRQDDVVGDGVALGLA